MKIYRWQELVSIAREKSPFYRDLYAKLTSHPSFEDLPIIDQDHFWQANTIENNSLLTEHLQDGIVFKSGGTTGAPKFSVYTREEWNTFTILFGKGMSHRGLRAGDRVANLFYVGELYASFIFIMKSLEAAEHPSLQFPMGGKDLPQNSLKTIHEFGIGVLAGVPTSILALADYYSSHREKFPALKIKKILFGGESFYADQRERLTKLFPGVEIFSIGYASVDAGLLGYADSSCGIDEHREFSQGTILEIIDEDSGAVITEPNRPGKAVITNLTRALMPIIRYPVGDRMVWLEPPGQDRKFQILGRSDEAARLGPVSIYYDDVRAILSRVVSVSGFQLEIRHTELKDRLILKVSLTDSSQATDTTTQKVVEAFSKERPMFAEAVSAGIIHPLNIEWTPLSRLEINRRTGKLRRVLDLRL